MSNTLETPGELIDYMNAVIDTKKDPPVFWAALGVSEEAILHAAHLAGIALNISCEQVLTCMELGALLALRPTR